MLPLGFFCFNVIDVPNEKLYDKGEKSSARGKAGTQMEYEQFDRRLARECAKAFSQSTGLGCTLSDKTGRAFDEYGYGCESCGMCAAAGASHDRCVQAW